MGQRKTHYRVSGETEGVEPGLESLELRSRDCTGSPWGRVDPRRVGAEEAGELGDNAVEDMG